MAQQMISGYATRISTFGEGTQYEGSLHIDMTFGRKQTSLKDRSAFNAGTNTIPQLRLTVWDKELCSLLKDYPVGEQLTVVIDDVIMRNNVNGGWYHNANCLYAFEPEEGEPLKGPDMSKISSPALVNSGNLPV